MPFVREHYRWFWACVSVLLLGMTVVAGAREVRAQGIAGAWNDQMTAELEASYKDVYGLEENLSRLEAELRAQREKISADPTCLDFDCDALKKMGELAAKAQAASRASILLGRIALEQRRRLADNTEKVVSAIRKGKDQLAFTLWAQEIAQGAAELSVGVAVSLATGNPGTVTTAIQKIASTTLNFAGNKTIVAGVNKVSERTTGTGFTVGGAYAGMARDVGISKFGQDIAASLSGQLTSIGLFDVVSENAGKSKITIVPRFSAQDLSKGEALRGDYFKRLKNMPQVVDIIAGTLVTALTSGALNETRAYLENARRELTASMAAQRDYVVTITIQKMHNAELRRIRDRFVRVKDRVDSLRARCTKLALGKSCGDALSTALTRAESDRNRAVGAATTRRESASKSLAQARAAWKDMLGQVNDVHLKLRHARDGAVETEYLERNRATIERLATGAASADVRDKYRQQLNDLRGRKPLVDQRRAVKSLEDQRRGLWDRIDKQRALISQLSQKALAEYSETAETIDKAERVYFAAVSTARSKSLDCLGQTAETITVKAKSLRQLRQETGNTSLVPQEIYAPFRGALSGFATEVASLKIGSITKKSDNCQKVAVSGLEGCWFDVSRSADDDRSKPVIIKESGNGLTVDYRSVNRLFNGIIEGDVVKLSYKISGPAELAKFRWGREGGAPPPLKVLRQVYPKYTVSRSTLKRSNNDVLSGHSHGAYVTWNKESLVLSSFTPRDYPEKLVRDHSLKIRSIAFAGPDGQRRQSQKAGEKLFAVAMGSSGCAHAVDTIRVKSYVNDDSANFAWDILRETGRATLEFRSDLPGLRALIARMPADQVKSITLFDPKALRGSTLKIEPN